MNILALSLLVHDTMFRHYIYDIYEYMLILFTFYGCSLIMNAIR